MEANVHYNDFKGTVAAEISDLLGHPSGDLESIGRYFNIDESRLKIVGLSIRGTSKFEISLICVDKQKSTATKEYLVSMLCNIENEQEILDILFKQLHIVLYDRFDEKYINMEFDREVLYEEYHKKETDDEK